MAEPPAAAGPRRAVLAVAAAGAVAAAWAGSFAGSWQFDDWNVIVGDPRVASLSAWWASMPGIRPLLKLSYALNHQSGLGLAGFHAVNLALHAASALLALAILRRLARRACPEGPAGPDAADAALGGALLFALHPAQTEAVTYLSGRSMSLGGALALGSVATWLAGRDGARPALWAALSPALFALALGAREALVVLPLGLLLLEAADRRRPFAWREGLRAVAPHLAVAAAAAAAFLAAAPYRRMAAHALALRGPGENLLAQVGAVGWLAGQALLPWRLSADPGPAAPPEASPALLAGALALGVAVALALWQLRRRPAPAFALLWSLLWLAPSGWWLPRPEPANDRHLYLSLLGPAFLAGRWLLGPGAGRGRRAAAVALLAALGAGTALRHRVYADEVTFWTEAAAAAPANPRAHNNLAWALAARCQGEAAERELERALALDPGYVRAAVNLKLLREGALPAAQGCAAAVTAPRP